MNIFGGPYWPGKRDPLPPPAPSLDWHQQIADGVAAGVRETAERLADRAIKAIRLIEAAVLVFVVCAALTGTITFALVLLT